MKLVRQAKFPKDFFSSKAHSVRVGASMHGQMIHFVWKLGENVVETWLNFIDHYRPAIKATFSSDTCFDLNHSQECLLDRRSQLVPSF